VVDPGVGSFIDLPVMLELGGRWYVGPDNGLFDIVARQAGTGRCREILWRPESLSRSFHGRDLYAPVCAMLARGEMPASRCIDREDRHDWPDDLPQIIYIDHFGNCITGTRARSMDEARRIRIGDTRIEAATTFSDVPAGTAFWYENANGLAEIAVNRGSAAETLALRIGTGFRLESAP